MGEKICTETISIVRPRDQKKELIERTNYWEKFGFIRKGDITTVPEHPDHICQELVKEFK